MSALVDRIAVGFIAGGGLQRLLAGFVLVLALVVAEGLFGNLVQPKGRPGAFFRFRTHRRIVRARRRRQRWPRETYNKPCCEYQCRAPVGFEHHLAISPFCQSPTRNETPGRVGSGAEKGNLRATPGQKQGSFPVPGVPPAPISAVKIFLKSTRLVSAAPIDVMSLPPPDFLSRFPDGVR